MAGDEEKAEEEKDTELDLIAEQELLRLMRQFRVKSFAKYDWLVNAYLSKNDEVCDLHIKPCIYFRYWKEIKRLTLKKQQKHWEGSEKSFLI